MTCFLSQARSSAVRDPFSFQRKNIEILKIRFGEEALQVCEVTLKDMTDSKRIGVHVQSQKEVSFFAYQLSTADPLMPLRSPSSTQ
jgi:hypothetical protein